MPAAMESTVLFLSNDRPLLRLVERNVGGSKVSPVDCLNRIRRIERSHRLIIDPRAACAGCLDRLASIRHRIPREQIFLLSTRAHPQMLIRIAQASPGIVTSPQSLLSRFPQPAARNIVREAWSNRDAMLDPEQQSDRLRRFITSALEHARGRYTVADAASDLRLSVRHLTRLCERWWGVSPKILLTLARVSSIAVELRSPDLSIEEVAERHGYADLSTMSRQFKNYVGEPPGAYRRRHTGHHVRKRSGNVRKRHGQMEPPP